MMKPLAYYRFIAPACLAMRGMPITPETIEVEAQRLYLENK